MGTTGFAQVQIDDKTKQPKLYQIGLIEGHVTVTLLSDGSKHDIKPGEIFTFVPGKGFMIVPFDVPLLTKTSLFFKKFKNKLPNQKYIDEEIAQYEDDVSRGFIKPDGGPIQPNTNYAGIPTIPTTAFDSAGNAQGGNSTPPPPSNSNR